MKNLKFIIYQVLLISVALLTNIFFNQHIGPPLDFGDFIAFFVSLPIYLLVAYLIEKLYKWHHSISLKNKIFQTIVSFIIAVISFAVLDNIWYEITGKMLF